MKYWISVLLLSNLEEHSSVIIHSLKELISPTYTCDSKIDFVNSIDSNELSKHVFFACVSCNGALVPISTCIFCKKVFLRGCTECDETIESKCHDSCIILISLRNKFSTKFKD